MLREARLPVVINENGRPTRVSKHDVALRQLIHKAMKGDVNAMKLFFRYYQEASEQASLLAAQQAKDAENIKRKIFKELSTEQLEWLVAQQYEEAQLRAKARKIEVVMTFGQSLLGAPDHAFRSQHRVEVSVHPAFATATGLNVWL